MYAKWCKLAGKVPVIKTIAKSLRDDEVDQACKYFEVKYDVSPLEVSAGAILGFFVSFVGLFILLYRLGALISIPASMMFGYLALYAIYTYLPSKMKEATLIFSEVADLVYELIVLILITTNSIFQAIEAIANADIPYISEKFREIIYKINTEECLPEDAIKEFADSQPSMDLRRRLNMILALEHDPKQLSEFSFEGSSEINSALRKLNLELESRLLVIAMLLTYIPIFLVIIVAMEGYSTSLWSFVALAIYILIVRLLVKRVSGNLMSMRGKSAAWLPLKEEVNEVKAVSDFVVIFAGMLRIHGSPENAMVEATQYAEPKLRERILNAFAPVYQDQATYKDAIDEIINGTKTIRAKVLLRIAYIMSETNPVNAPQFLIRIAREIGIRNEFTEEKRNIIEAQGIKVELLSKTSAAVIGITVALAPFLSLNGIFFGGFGDIVLPHIPTFLDMWPLFTSMGVASFYASYASSKMVGGKHPLLSGTVGILIYVIVLAIIGKMTLTLNFH